MGGNQLCFKCLCRQIQADFSDKLIFSHAVSDYAFPFASSAVVQMSSASSPQFILAYLPRIGECLKKYIDDCCPEHDNYSGINQNTIVSITNRDQADELVADSFTGAAAKGTPLSGYTCQSLVCYCSDRFSCTRTITALAPIACVQLSSYSAFEEIASKYVSEPIEDHILSSLSSLIEGKTSSRDSRNFLTLIGIPSFHEDTLPGCLRHPNIAPVLGMLKTSRYINIVVPKTMFTLENILHYSPNALKSDWHKSFLIYQILSALAYMHGLGIAHGNICPSNVMLSGSCWSWLRVVDNPQLSCSRGTRNRGLSPSSPLETTACCIEDCPSRALYADLKLSQSIDWGSAFTGWWSGELSNFEYLLILNRLAGRRWGDHAFHMVMPWVVDFSVNPDETNNTGWRDLRKSKWRLAKGDEQLDFTYSTSEIPHHISDECLSELAVCSYKARRLPLSVLRTAVRSVYEPNEYPSSMQRLYQWTPDECIPEFYCDPEVFYSMHTGMTDLAVPSWAGTPEEFIRLHRRALESNRVSCEIHHWIDITFGYKMAGMEAITAKNVMLPASASTTFRSAGRRQLFTHPHPSRRTREPTLDELQANCIGDDRSLLSETAHLQELKEAAAFREHAWHLTPVYCYHLKKIEEDSYAERPLGSDRNIYKERDCDVQSNMNLPYLLENIKLDNDTCVGYHELLLWMEKPPCSGIFSHNIANDIFSVGCILAELYLGRPLFDPISLDLFLESGALPRLMQELPPHTKILVEACILRDWKRRPSAKSLLECPYFPPAVRSSYLFLAPLQLLVKDGSRLRYAATFAKEGAFKAMGPLASEMCALYCLPLLMTPMSDTETEWAYMLLNEFLKCLNTEAVKTHILPAIQKILQTTDYSHLKVSLLQDSFVREIWKQTGRQTYLETIHPVVISNLHVAPHKSSAAAASVLLIGSSEELGVPVTVHQTILPLIHCFGKGLCADGIDVLVRIGCLLGEKFVVIQILPLLRNVVHSCIDALCMNKPEPQQSWSSLAIIDCLMTLDGVVAVLPRDVVVKELIEDGSSLHVMILTQTNLELAVLQVAATSLLAVCELIGPDLAALHVLPKLKELFEELAFSQETTTVPGIPHRCLKVSKPLESEESQTASRMDLVWFLYPPLATLLGIEKLRQCCATWLLLEQFLLQCHKWKWEYAGESFRSSPDNTGVERPIYSRSSTSDYTPAKLLLNGVGWSMPQSQGYKGASHLMQYRRANELQQNLVERQVKASTFGKPEPWHWFPSAAGSCDGPGYLGRAGSLKDERPWKIRASVINSTRAHHGAIRCLAVCQDECTVFTAGVGPGFKGTVQKWDLSRIDCSPGYCGHDEVVNDISVFSFSDRVASCDGTVHVWNSQTGKLVSIFSESSTTAHVASSLASASKINSDESSMLNSSPLSSGILSTAFDGSLYTCMHHLEFDEKLVVGTGNGCLRFIDVHQAQKLHLWRSESAESSFHSLISSICSCGSGKMQTNGIEASPSWIAAGLSSGICRLLDVRSGNIISSWRAHDGYVTKLAAPEEHLLISSSLDRTLRVWDLRRSLPPVPTIFRGHSDSVSDFAVWGQDVVSIAKNKIGLSSLSRAAYEDGEHRVTPHHLYSADRGVRNMSALSSLSILPFSRLFLVGTEDGHLKICC